MFPMVKMAEPAVFFIVPSSKETCLVSLSFLPSVRSVAVSFSCLKSIMISSVTRLYNFN